MPNYYCEFLFELLDYQYLLGNRNGYQMSKASPCLLFASQSLLKVLNGFQVNGCTGKMGRAVLEAAMAAGLNPVPVALGGEEDSGKILDFSGKQIEVHGPSDRESVLSSIFSDYPNLIVVDYTVPAAVNGKHMLISP